MLASAILSLLIFVTPNPSIAAFSAFGLVLAAFAAFFVPLRPLHRLIDAVKRAELAGVRAAIRQQSAARIGADEAWVPPNSRVSDLIVYEARIERVSSWAFDTPTAIRFGLYLSVGIGSWLGAALVERFLSSVLDS